MKLGMEQTRRAYRPDWRRLIDEALDAASKPEHGGAQLMLLARRATEWVLPTESAEDAYVFVALIHVAKAYFKQLTVGRRTRVASSLQAIALAAGELLEAADPPPPVRRFRPDLDG